MKRRMKLTHEFVEYIPDCLADGVIYVSIPYATAVHKCCCGCGNEVITPITPTDWELTFDGQSISLSPSIGNWNFACKSHYWIRRNRIIWAPSWSRERINFGRAFDALVKERYFESAKAWRPNDTTTGIEQQEEDKPKENHLWKPEK